jgi:hypothetical protein
MLEPSQIERGGLKARCLQLQTTRYVMVVGEGETLTNELWARDSYAVQETFKPNMTSRLSLDLHTGL